MRLFFATDIHGANRVFNKFLNSLRIFDADVGIIGGDIMVKRLVPIVENNDGTYAFEYFGEQRILSAAKAKTDLQQMEAMLNDSGYYTYRTTAEEFAKLKGNADYLNQVFERVMLKRLETWIGIIPKKLAGTDIKVFITGGNDDLPIIDNFLKGLKYLNYCESEVVNVSPDHQMVSSGYANMTPWKCPRDIPEEELEEKLETMASKVADMKSCIFNLHVPPIATSLDQCPRLDTGVDPPKIIVGETTNGGSTSVRKMIEKYQPLISLHGHIHESRGAEKIGKTLCINPGSEYTEGILRGVIVNLNQYKVKGYQFTSG
jgi:Icc-related predicted phosphoesterase